MIAPLPVSESLNYLAETSMIRRLDDAEPAYMIKHALVQDMAQATLLRNESKRLHHLVGITLEAVNAERLDDYAAELALHFAHAEDETRTLAYSIRAGDVAARIFANAEALDHYGRAIEIACRGIATPQQIIELYTRRGRILEVTGKYREALASYQELHELAEQRRDRSLELASLMLRAPVYSAPMSEFNAILAKQLLLDALGMARELSDETAEARVLWNLSLLSTQTLLPRDGVMYGELALALAEKLDLQEQKAYTLHELFLPYRVTGQAERARLVQLQARELFRAADNKSMLADNLGMAAQFAVYEGDLEHALEIATEGIVVSRAIGNPFGVLFNSVFATFAHLERGENGKGLEMICQRIEHTERNRSTMNPMVTAMDAWFLAAAGAISDSRQVESSARELENVDMPPIFRAGYHGAMARIRLIYRDTDSAAADIARGVAEPGMGAAVLASNQLPFAQAELALIRGDYSSVNEILTEQNQMARLNEFRLVLVENLLLQGQAYVGMHQLPTAIAILNEALTLAGTIGSRRLEWQILATLARAERLGGNPVQANHYNDQARAVLTYIVEHTPPEYRAGFLKVAAVAEVMN